MKKIGSAAAPGIAAGVRFEVAPFYARVFQADAGAAPDWRALVKAVLAGRGRETARDGRGAIYLFPEGSRNSWLVVRRYRHGGMLRALSGTRFFSPRRFLDELATHLHLSRLGLPLPEAVGIVMLRQPGHLFVRGLFVSRRLPDVLPLAEYLPRCHLRRRLLLARALGRDLARIHAAGVYYSDLHIRNILVQVGSSQHLFIDFDKCRISSQPLSWARRRANFYRFFRSLDKYCARGGRFSALERTALLQAYAPDPQAYESLRRKLDRGLLWRRLFYQLGWWLNRS